MTSKLIRIAAVAGIAVAAAGCANHDELRAEIQEAMNKAESAQQSADKAQQTADRALKGAQEAKTEARNASECCKANTKRIDRMFEASQAK